MRVSDSGINLIKGFEGLRLDAYLDYPGKIPTIGWGHTANVKLGDVITETEAEFLLRKDLAPVEEFLNFVVVGPYERKFGPTFAINQNMFDALASFTFNEGEGKLRCSTLLKKLLNGDLNGAADQFLLWDKAHDPDGNIIAVPDLQQRRVAERDLFLSPP